MYPHFSCLAWLTKGCRPTPSPLLYCNACLHFRAVNAIIIFYHHQIFMCSKSVFQFSLVHHKLVYKVCRLRLVFNSCISIQIAKRKEASNHNIANRLLSTSDSQMAVLSWWRYEGFLGWRHHNVQPATFSSWVPYFWKALEISQPFKSNHLLTKPFPFLYASLVYSWR